MSDLAVRITGDSVEDSTGDLAVDRIADSPARASLVALRDGDTALEAGDATSAAARYGAAVDAARLAADDTLESRALSRLGDARRAGGDHDRAIAAFNGALKAARRAGVPKAIGAAHRELSLACEAADRFEPALVHFKAFHAIETERLRSERRRAREALQASRPDGTAAPAEAPTDFAPPSDLVPEDFETVEPLERMNAVEPIEPLATADPADPAEPDPPAELTIDTLTLLGNALACERRLAHSMADARIDVALVVLDVDHLASLNDTFGAVSGDDVLRRVGLVLLEQLKPGDPAFRVSGDRFHVLLHGPAARTATAVAERLHQAIALHPWHEVARGLAVTVSLGVAVSRPGADDAELLEQRARHALRMAKDEGRDRVVVDEP